MECVTQRMRHSAAVVLLMCGVGLLAGCGNDVGNGTSASATTAGAPPTTVVVTSSVTVPVTTAAPATRPQASVAPATPTAPPPTAATTSGTLDWDGVRYDFGRITGLSSNENQDLITFDRYQLYGDGGELLSAANFTEEPIVVGNSDVPWVNDNPKERTYVLDPEAEVLSLANPGRIACGGNDQTESPEWQSGTVEDLFRIGTPDSDQVSLMFSKEGKVVLVRISQGC